VSSEVTEPDRSRRIAALAFDYGARKTEDVAECNLCGGTRLFEAASRDRYGYPASLQLCLRCGLGFLSPRFTAEEYGHFYGRVYRPLVSAYHGRLIDADTVQDEQRAYAAELLGFLRASLQHMPDTVLDVGGSTGVVSAAVSANFGAWATVIDPSQDELAHAAASGLETVSGFAEDVDLGDRKFGVVLLCQTIDHLLDVDSALRAIRGWVARDGHVFVDILDLELVALRQRSLEGAIKIDHPFYLTRDTALAFFSKVGLRPVAERRTDDGHLGFLLEPAEPEEPDWDELHRAADRFRERLRRLGTPT